MSTNGTGRPDVAVFFARYHYLNPGIPLLLEHYASGAVPGVAGIDVTSTPLPEILAVAAGARAILIDQSLSNAAALPRINRNLVYHVVRPLPTAQYQEIFSRLLEVPVARAFLTTADLHEPRGEPPHAPVEGLVDALFWYYEKRPLAVSEIPPQYRDGFMQLAPDPVQRWQNVRARFPVRVEVIFPISRAEITNSSIRRWDACVPGVNYTTRRAARNAVRRAGLSLAPFRAASMGLRVAGRAVQQLTPNERRVKWMIGSQWKMQAWFLSKSRCTFVCGSGAGYPARKFLEIPAAGSAMVAYPCRGFEDFGFQDGVNCVVADPAESGKAARTMIANPVRRDQMTRAALDLLLHSHTVEQRSADLAECLRRMGSGTLRGAEFIGGRFEIT